MINVLANTSFEHNGRHRRGDVWPCSPQVAEALAARGLVRILGDGTVPTANPPTAAGANASASPAAPASPTLTSKPSARGGKKAKTAPSSS